MDELFNEIDRLREQNTLIIVEGKKDKESLIKLGLTNIKTLNKPLYQIGY